MNPHMLPKVRSKKIMSSAKGQPCTLRIASFLGKGCSGPDTTVGCHLPVWGKGVSTKVTDLAVAFGCQRCHDLIDGRDRAGWEYLMKHCEAGVVERMLHGLTETHAMLVQEGVIQIPDGKDV